MKKTILLTALFVACSFLAVAALRMFRTQSVSHPYFGELSLQFRWGRPHLLIMDINSDSKSDFKAIWPGYEDGDPPVECWSDPNAQGYFEYHVIFDQDGLPKNVEIDEDGDGRFDRILSHEEVDRLLTAEFIEWRQFQQQP